MTEHSFVVFQDAMILGAFKSTKRRERNTWCVVYDGHLCEPRFPSRAAAYAYLAKLQRGTQKPEDRS